MLGWRRWSRESPGTVFVTTLTLTVTGPAPAPFSLSLKISHSSIPSEVPTHKLSSTQLCIVVQTYLHCIPRPFQNARLPTLPPAGPIISIVLIILAVFRINHPSLSLPPTHPVHYSTEIRSTPSTSTDLDPVRPLTLTHSRTVPDLPAPKTDSPCTPAETAHT
jgi:hypothetical protein